MDTWVPGYFPADSVQTLGALPGKVLQAVHYTFWKNVAKAHDVFQSLDWIELHWQDSSLTTFGTGEESEGIALRDLDLLAEQARIRHQFNGQVELSRSEVSGAYVWREAIGQPLRRVELVAAEQPSLFHNHVLTLDFGAATIRLRLMQEGMMAERVS